jgi:hypothetical protein
LSPSKTTYNIVNILINEGIENAVTYMTTGYTYYKYVGNENYTSVDYTTECQMNKTTGLGNTHFTINDEYKKKLKMRLEQLLQHIKSGENIIFVYADAANPYLNYYLDDIEYGVDATEYLLKIQSLIYPLNNNIKIVYFCWNERKSENNNINSENYPIILFQNDEYTKIHITESEIEKYSNLDMTFEDMQTQWALHGNAVPIVTIVD